eukprot:CAMPEP_0197591342 /NCGR_PEP_ID=MMETSP1326-20131121/13020_1 /TAXON_ID=1155430 /ORGANISM="Genus nov. species nov., Strain RCC2288" /LENGTH=271 /DNA_ID=CAMNT_0043156747 /DNA_START=159 /DNA_END=970 /DNA_ORIENTATION=-
MASSSALISSCSSAFNGVSPAPASTSARRAGAAVRPVRCVAGGPAKSEPPQSEGPPSLARRAVVLGSFALGTASIEKFRIFADSRALVGNIMKAVDIPPASAMAAENVVVVDAASSSSAGTPAMPPSAKNVIITGSNSGIGYDAAAKLAAMGYNVTLACRSLAKAQDAKQRMEDDAAAGTGGPITGAIIPAECNLADLASVRRFAAGWHASGQPLDVLVLNAGVQFSGDNDMRKTADGFEITVGTNHLGHFLLTNLLMPDLEAAGGVGAAG